MRRPARPICAHFKAESTGFIEAREPSLGRWEYRTGYVCPECGAHFVETHVVGPENGAHLAGTAAARRRDAMD